jgi:selT/selW/selH-like putative selenoprotein
VRAASLAAELNEVGHEASIEEGAKGQFEVFADGSVVFSKQEEGRFPEGSEIRALLSDQP